jgi:putative PIN family toxin of toxin-antitoxin system
LWWVARRIQLIVSPQAIAEYRDIFGRLLEATAAHLAAWRMRFEDDSRCTLVKLGPRFDVSRDPDDNVLLATALAGDADYLVTNDRDLLELPDDFQRRLPFAIVSPSAFLREIGED